jgi:thioredoxin 1
MKSITSIILTTLFIFISITGCNSSNTKKEAAREYTEKQINESAKSSESTTSGDVLILSDQMFEKTIAKGVVLIDFWATWCAPCRVQGPIVDEIAKEMKGKVTVCKMDVDKNPATPGRFNVQYIPTIIIFKDGKVIETLTGLNNKETLIAKLNKVLK